MCASVRALVMAKQYRLPRRRLPCHARAVQHTSTSHDVVPYGVQTQLQGQPRQSHNMQRRRPSSREDASGALLCDLLLRRELAAADAVRLSYADDACVGGGCSRNTRQDTARRTTAAGAAATAHTSRSTDDDGDDEYDEACTMQQLLLQPLRTALLSVACVPTALPLACYHALLFATLHDASDVDLPALLAHQARAHADTTTRIVSQAHVRLLQAQSSSSSSSTTPAVPSSLSPSCVHASASSLSWSSRLLGGAAPAAEACLRACVLYTHTAAHAHNATVATSSSEQTTTQQQQQHCNALVRAHYRHGASNSLCAGNVADVSSMQMHIDLVAAMLTPASPPSCDAALVCDDQLTQGTRAPHKRACDTQTQLAPATATPPSLLLVPRWLRGTVPMTVLRPLLQRVAQPALLRPLVRGALTCVAHTTNASDDTTRTTATGAADAAAAAQRLYVCADMLHALLDNDAFFASTTFAAMHDLVLHEVLPRLLHAHDSLRDVGQGRSRATTDVTREQQRQQQRRRDAAAAATTAPRVHWTALLNRLARVYGKQRAGQHLYACYRRIFANCTHSAVHAVHDRVYATRACADATGNEDHSQCDKDTCDLQIHHRTDDTRSACQHTSDGTTLSATTAAAARAKTEVAATAHVHANAKRPCICTHVPVSFHVRVMGALLDERAARSPDVRTSTTVDDKTAYDDEQLWRRLTHIAHVALKRSAHMYVHTRATPVTTDERAQRKQGKAHVTSEFALTTTSPHRSCESHDAHIRAVYIILHKAATLLAPPHDATKRMQAAYALCTKANTECTHRHVNSMSQ